eukprot:CAMPEP_0119102662 /NCGR_PEP_ID=MMETSP1180-20130426/1331_1 /TAXON_ID=3052 ORGANISM="Chlamydomonas cf sp, Strain CCMP681" /NCGR_SAMPLE_ID=MMETSP1180 /ASSEMBLY_ACC=CAM_ASM_000741 /LENGTH=194 /DNA_ID=CAMNT_0007086987 /DNA_START=18 /DNA_END=605 /DNA_ORIENTATION=-
MPGELPAPAVHCLLQGKSYVEVSASPLDLMGLYQRVSDPGAGAISTFIGVTRNNFGGKEVLRLEYEAYVPMALKKLQEVCEALNQRWEVIQVAVAHRIGVVSVGEASVIIAVSSAHRAASLEAVHWAIDELKAVVPIWKQEFFTDGSEWKENAESRARLLHQEGQTEQQGQRQQQQVHQEEGQQEQLPQEQGLD